MYNYMVFMRFGFFDGNLKIFFFGNLGSFDVCIKDYKKLVFDVVK